MSKQRQRRKSRGQRAATRPPSNRERAVPSDRPRGRRTVTRPPRRRWLWLMGAVILLVGVGTLLWSPWSRQGTVPPNTVIAAEQSAAAPPFTLPGDTGDQVELAEYLGKQPVVLVFYMGDF